MKLKNLGLATIMFCSLSAVCQEDHIIINRDARIDQLLETREKILKENMGFQIQIFSGNRESAFTLISEARLLYDNNEVTLQYQTPNYKVWIGKFFDRLSADKFLMEVKKTYPNAFVLRPIDREKNKL